MSFSLSTNPAAEGRRVTGGWSRIEFVVGQCPLRETARGYEIDLAPRGRALSLELTSQADEVPLDIRFAGGPVSRRQVAFSDEMKSRWVMIDLKDRKESGVSIESDTLFSVESCRQVWRPWRRDLDTYLIYDADMCVYENTAAIAKGFCIDKEKVTHAETDSAGSLLLSSLTDIPAAVCGTCEMTSYEPERVEVQVTAAADCYLLLQDMYYPGWRARVDGKETAVLKTDIGIRAVEIPDGEHTVVFEFKPASFYVGLALTLVGLILTLAYALRARPRVPDSLET